VFVFAYIEKVNDTGCEIFITDITFYLAYSTWKEILVFVS